MNINDEIKCFNSIKRSFLSKDEYQGKLILDFSNADKCEISDILNSVRKNPNFNAFPDFIFDGGYIEHFEITSSHEDKKGSFEKINSFRYQKEIDKQVKKKLLDSNIKPGVIETDCNVRVSQNCSRENLIKSFKKHWCSHIESLNKSNYKNQLGIFLIDTTGSLPFTYIDGKFKFHSFYYDIEILEFIKCYKNEIKFVIRKYFDRYEIIDLNKIEDLISECPMNIKWQMGRNVEHNTTIFLDYFPYIGCIKKE